MSLNLSAAWNLNIDCQAKNAGNIGTFGLSERKKAWQVVWSVWRAVAMP
jgi:hypothetical protein